MFLSNTHPSGRQYFICKETKKHIQKKNFLLYNKIEKFLNKDLPLAEKHFFSCFSSHKCLSPFAPQSGGLRPSLGFATAKRKAGGYALRLWRCAAVLRLGEALAGGIAHFFAFFAFFALQKRSKKKQSKTKQKEKSNPPQQ